MVIGYSAEIEIKRVPTFYYINLNGKKINYQNFSSKFLINKPKYKITICSDNNCSKTIVKALPEEYKKQFFPKGRLYFLSRDLILFTNFGRSCYELNNLKFGYKKTYILRRNGKFKKFLIEVWQEISDSKGKESRLCKIKILKNYQKFFIKVISKERINLKIRIITNFLDFKLNDLKSTGFGSFSLDGLKEGEWNLIKAFNFEDIK